VAALDLGDRLGAEHREHKPFKRAPPLIRRAQRRALALQIVFSYRTQRVCSCQRGALGLLELGLARINALIELVLCVGGGLACFGQRRAAVAERQLPRPSSMPISERKR